MSRGSVGSPPRLRGKHTKSHVFRLFSGLTPAPAGKTCRIPSIRRRKWAHPRACGENLGLSKHSMSFRGSPPRLRGKPKKNKVAPALFGLTPAPAGKTGALLAPFKQKKAHPRACGENCKGGYVCVLYRRLTPAPAGKTHGIIAIPRALWAHPRACGENRRRRYWRQWRDGSPPRLRGKLVGDDFNCILAGLTPAPAGKTQYHRENSQEAKAHPRACGENQVS